MQYKQGGLGQVQQQSLKQTLSTQQIQYVKLLQMNTVEFNQYLNELHLENPVVDLEAPTYQPQSSSAGAGSESIDLARWIGERPVQRAEEDPNEGTDGPMEYERQHDDDRDNLQAYLRSQFDLSLTDFDLSLLERLIDSLDENGYLTVDVPQLAEMGHDPALAREAIAYLQTLDPAGIGAHDLSECLSIQLTRLGFVEPMIYEMVQQHLDELALGHFQKVARALDCSATQVKEFYKVIRGLDPRPASSFGGEAARYILPDVSIVERPDGSAAVVYNRQYSAGLNVNKGYLALAQSDPSAQDYINRKMSQALWVIKAIQSRQNTIERIVTSILERQHAFFCEQGDLVPMRLRDVSELLQVHESTVSRAINEKYLQCKRGIYPLKYFFSGSPSSSSASCLDDSQAVGSRSIKERMRELIAAENPHKPLSDSELANALAADGIHLARRTVAKYRDELGILSSAMRKQ